VKTEVGVETVLGGVLENRREDKFGERICLEEETDKGLFGDGREDEGRFRELQTRSVVNQQMCCWTK
jgi:hypothetical protein